MGMAEYGEEYEDTEVANFLLDRLNSAMLGLLNSS